MPSGGRSPRRGEVWSIYYADIGEAVTYCLECAKREFGDLDEYKRRRSITRSPMFKPPSSSQIRAPRLKFGRGDAERKNVEAALRRPLT